MRVPENICLECGTQFDEPARFVETHGLESPPYEEFYGCPNCGGAYTPTIQCDGCGQVITGDYVKIHSTGDCYCDACFTQKTLGEELI